MKLYGASERPMAIDHRRLSYRLHRYRQSPVGSATSSSRAHGAGPGRDESSGTAGPRTREMGELLTGLRVSVILGRQFLPIQPPRRRGMIIYLKGIKGLS